MMRRTVRQSMYIKKIDKPKEIPLMVQQAKTNVVISLFSFVCFIGFVGMMGFQLATNRYRDDESQKRRGKHVIVVGGGAAGSAVAAHLIRNDHRVRVTVFDGSRTQELTSHYALAAAGHRSYDLGTRAQNTLTSPTSWTVCKDASLVLQPVVSIDPSKNEIVDGAGTTHSYDALVVAMGATRDPTVVKGLTADVMDRNFIGIHPHGIRDGLMSTFFGGVLAVRVAGGDSYVRGAEGYWLSAVNATWKFLKHFGRIGGPRGDIGATYTAITSDSTVCDMLHPDYRSAIESLWKERDIPILTNLNLIEVNAKSRVATFEVVPRAGTTTPSAAELTEAAPSTLQRTVRRSPTTGRELVDISYRTMLLDLPLAPPKLLREAGLAEPGTDGFASVDWRTLQSTKFPNIFALGDCAALPVAKSYGAVFAQAPVVAQNVLNVIHGRPQQPLYDGYTSFHVNMTTWRVMWPEQRGFEVSTPERAQSHIWDDAHDNWRGVKGTLQGVYFQLFIHEFMHWFVFVRGHWYPPRWFRAPPFFGVEPVGSKEGRVAAL